MLPSDHHQDRVFPFPFHECQADFGFEGSLMVGLGLEIACDHRRRFGQGFFRISLDDGLAVADVGAVGVKAGSALRHGVRRRGEDRQHFVVHRYGSRGGQGLFAGVRRDGGHGVAQKPDRVFTKEGAVGDDVFDAVRSLDVLGRQDSRDAGQCFGPRGVDALDERMGMRASNHREFKRPRHCDIGSELGRSAGLHIG